MSNSKLSMYLATKVFLRFWDCDSNFLRSGPMQELDISKPSIVITYQRLILRFIDFQDI